MTSVASTTSSESRGLHAAASRDARNGSPRKRLQKLLAVPGSAPNRNFQEEMALQPEGAQWLSWSLEQVAFTLGRRFPDRYIWVIRASRMYLHKFSCYHNFVESNMFGAPEHSPYSPDYGAFHHLRALLSHGMECANLPNPLQPQGGADSIPSGFSLALVGFSKGCVVLNQMVYELGGARADPLMSPFIKCISAMYWLDGGHPGGSETWVTDKLVLKELAASGVLAAAREKKGVLGDISGTPVLEKDEPTSCSDNEHSHTLRPPSLLLESKPFRVRVRRLKEVLLVLGVFGRGCPLGATAPFADGAGGGGVGAQAELLLPQPRVAHTLCSAGPVPVVRAQQRALR
ncbi:hypothetical protein INR49_026779, partial [Caranx melampygus]